MAETITSAANPVARRVRLLADRKHRRQEAAFVVDGIQPVWRAVEAGWEIETLIVAPDLLAGSPAARMVIEQESAGTRVARMSSELFQRLSTREGPPGLAAIVRSRLRGLPDLAVRSDSVFVVLHGVGNPGNLGTIIRTADATGCAGVVLVGETSDPFAPAAVKASMGSLFAVDVVHVPEPEDFLGWARERGVHVVATSGSADQDYRELTCPTPLAVLFGAEGPGLPAELLRRSAQQVRIPMVGTAESLNLAVAAGVMMYELRRDALRGPAPAGG